MRGDIVHTIITMAGPGEADSPRIVVRPTKSSPGYEEYYPSYKVRECIASVGGVSRPASAVVKTFRGEFLIVEVRAAFAAETAEPAQSLKGEMNEAALKIALRHGGLSISEEYTFFCVIDYDDYEDFVEQNRLMIAQLLKDETASLTGAEIENTLASSLRYDRDDLTVIEWDGALLLDKGGQFEDNITLIELANIQLVSLRALDARLTAEIDRFRRMGAAQAPNMMRLSRFLKSIISVRTQSLLDLDSIDNSIKLYGEWYDAKVYSLAAGKLHIGQWRGAVDGKLEVLEKMFEMVSARQGETYNVILEISIVLLIVLEIVLLVLGYE